MATVTAGFQVLPNGKDMNTDGVIPQMVDVIKASGLKYEVGPMETVVEGNFDDIMLLIKTTQQVGIEMGATEVLTNIKLHYKPDGISIANKLTHLS
ncbi:thiamine-binding protein [Metabacillus litoralis]|uniref:Thiamine-binding protein n=1 Tax=Metabacillus litoralis TaxID=152268 RepID=A0A5C6W4N7_9BACI|nr:MTH1187 family thiamine-binding protein [Metabacillus litoralis]TXC91362.1 thiamine-binding protein [Metabacillus litoralis]